MRTVSRCDGGVRTSMLAPIADRYFFSAPRIWRAADRTTTHSLLRSLRSKSPITMDVDDTVASPGAPLDDVDEVVRRQLNDVLLTVQRGRQVAFEREKETLGNATKALDDETRHIQDEMRKFEQRLREIEREKAANATKERRSEAIYHDAVRKLDRWREDGVVDLQRSWPGMVSGFPFAMC